MPAAVVADNRAHIFRNCGQIAHQLFRRLRSKLSVFVDRTVQVGHISLVMLVMVQLHRRLVDGRLEGGIVIGKGRKFKSHGSTPLSFTFSAKPGSAKLTLLDALSAWAVRTRFEGSTPSLFNGVAQRHRKNSPSRALS